MLKNLEKNLLFFLIFFLVSFESPHAARVKSLFFFDAETTCDWVICDVKTALRKTANKSEIAMHMNFHLLFFDE